MLRPRAISRRDAVSDTDTRGDQFIQRLIKYIPAEVIGAHVAAMGTIDKESLTWKWIVLGFLLVVSFVWTLFSTRSKDSPHWQWFQAVAAPIAFATWAFALGGPFEATFASYSRPIASVVLILVSLAIPAIDMVIDHFMADRSRP